MSVRQKGCHSDSRRKHFFLSKFSRFQTILNEMTTLGKSAHALNSFLHKLCDWKRIKKTSWNLKGNAFQMIKKGDSPSGPLENSARFFVVRLSMLPTPIGENLKMIKFLFVLMWDVSIGIGYGKINNSMSKQRTREERTDLQIVNRNKSSPHCNACRPWRTMSKSGNPQFANWYKSKGATVMP